MRNGYVTVDTVGSAFNTTLGVYTGGAVSGLSKIAANNDAASTVRTSRVRFNASAGRAHRIAVDGYAAATGSLTLNLKYG